MKINIETEYNIGQIVSAKSADLNNRDLPLKVVRIKLHIVKPSIVEVTYDIQFVDDVLQERWGGYTDIPEKKIQTINKDSTEED